MNITQMRYIDRYVGAWACAFLSLFKWAFMHNLQLKKPFAPPKKILLIKFWGMGSIVLASDLIQAIKSAYPTVNICAVTLKRNSCIFRMLGIVDRIIELEVKNLIEFIIGFLKMLFYLSRSKFDIVFDLEFTTRFSAIVSFFCRAEKKVGFFYPGIWRGNFFTKLVRFSPEKKAKEQFLRLAKALKVKISKYNRPSLDIPVKDRECILRLLKEENIRVEDFIVVFNINASELCLLRRWPKEYFITLAKQLVNEYNAHVIFIGDKTQTSYVNEALALEKGTPFFHNLSGKTNLGQLAYLLKLSKFFVTNDSGPLHLAVYLDVPTVSFFGPESPKIYGPEGTKHIVFYKALECSPCIQLKRYKEVYCNNDRKCLKGIMPEEVFSTIRNNYSFR